MKNRSIFTLMEDIKEFEMLSVNTGADIEAAYRECRRITEAHYENFPVASRLLPPDVRKHIYPIYAFARHADDLADEHGDEEGLMHWREMLYRCGEEPVSHPIFLALGDTIRKKNIPVALLDNLLSAFQQDLTKNRYQDLTELLHYCRFSANPVGRIILLLHGYRDDSLMQFSDNICTALQLTNFWQDVSLDILKNRLYIPLSYLDKHGIKEEEIFSGRTSQNFQRLMTELVRETRQLYRNGAGLLSHIRGRLHWELYFTIAGGRRVLDKIQRIDYNVLQQRVKLTKRDWFLILMKGAIKTKRRYE